MKRMSRTPDGRIRTPDRRFVPRRRVRLYRLTPPGPQTLVQMTTIHADGAELIKPARANSGRAADAPPRIATDSERSDLSRDLAA